MIPARTLTLTESIHTRLKRHLFPDDGKEAAAVLICTAVPGERVRLLSKDVILVPYEDCARREKDSLTWPSEYIEHAIDMAASRKLSIILVHSHPGGYAHFSAVDDRSDGEIIPAIFEAGGQMHGTAVMLPTGAMFGRVYAQEIVADPIDLISVAGHDLHYWWWQEKECLPAGKRLAFTSAMTDELSRLVACVIGVSGTGSIVAEQLCRLGFGRVIVVDHDHVEYKNLNRILNTTADDARHARKKVEVFARQANAYRDQLYVLPIEVNVLTREAVIAAAQADVIFSCVDTHRGRSVADRMAAAFLLPLFDVGVAIPTREAGDGQYAIDEATGRIDYVYPGGSSLYDRGVYSAASLQAEDLAESDPAAHADQVRRGYIEGIPEQAPSVITLNMRAASACVMEFIARAYPFRHEDNALCARTRFMLAECVEEFTAEKEFVARCSPILACGDEDPLIGLPVLGRRREQ